MECLIIALSEIYC